MVSPVTGTAGVGMAAAFVVSYVSASVSSFSNRAPLLFSCVCLKCPNSPSPAAKAMLPIAITITIAKTSAAEIFFFIIGCSPLTMRLSICACCRSETCRPER